MLKPDGRVIMISGANRGIGLATARVLYDAGFSLSLGARNPDAFRDLVADWNPDRVMTGHYEAENQQTHQEWIDATVARFGRIDGLVNNAGILKSVSVEEGSDDDLDLMWAINVKAPLSMTRKALPHLRRSGAGRVINVASLAGKVVYDSGIGYSMTKFAAVALSHATRHAGWDDGVRCTALCPGYVATDMTARVESVPQAEMIPPGDLAQIVLTVLSLSNAASVAEIAVNCRDGLTA
ncbi:MAG: SDR family NAD(P)-dependent oxidoreductase [Minwuia sp.]|nr:SDR family NAD(P)-dependent oxidoreductase [Minwuia sp.]